MVMSASPLWSRDHGVHSSVSTGASLPQRMSSFVLHDLTPEIHTVPKQVIIYKIKFLYKKSSFIYRSTDAWNRLPQSVVDAPSVQSFEVKIDKLWKNHPIK